MLSSVLIELTSFIMLLEMTIASVRIRRFTRQQRKKRALQETMFPMKVMRIPLKRKARILRIFPLKRLYRRPAMNRQSL